MNQMFSRQIGHAQFLLDNAIVAMLYFISRDPNEAKRFARQSAHHARKLLKLQNRAAKLHTPAIHVFSGRNMTGVYGTKRSHIDGQTYTRNGIRVSQFALRVR
jgi:hypothetical protein